MAEGTSYGVEIELKEDKVYAHLDEEKESDVRTSILDTEATNHMFGSRAKVTRLDTVVLGTVHFDDDSVAQIEGHGTVVFVCKNDESRSLDGIYLIPRLTTNIMSVGQLDEAGYKINIDTYMMKIHEPGGLLLVKVKHKVNHLYLLHIKLT
jgi:hypothetical protein